MRNWIDLVESFMDVSRLKKQIPWLPNEGQLTAAISLADAFYSAGFGDDYSFDQFQQDVETNLAQIANDDGPMDSLASLTPEMGMLLHTYGEQNDWTGLTPAGYKQWASS